VRLDLKIPAAHPVDLDPAGAAVAVEGLGMQYGRLAALSDVSLTAAAREIVCLLGPSGSGKSTLLRLIAGVERPASGRIVLDGEEAAGPCRFVEPERRRVGMVFQDYALFPHLTVAANVAFGLERRRQAKAGARVDALLERFDLTRYKNSYPYMLSGGERQRVAVARALAPDPRVLLMDEPFASLDGRLRDHVRRRTLDLLRESGTTTIFVTHDPAEAMRIADRIVLLDAGRVVQCGPPEEVYMRPATLFAARFFSDLNEVPGVCLNGRIETAIGSFEAPHLPDHAPARVCIRPQHLRLAQHPTGVAARVVRTAFLGEIDHLELAVAGLDAPITLRTFGRTRVEPEDVVYLDVQPGEVLVVAHDERGQR
jgi:iron(III) transport system ATP-binding protein